jgi:hypothetical protein
MTRRVESARRNGSLGGKQGSLNLTEEQREERARAGGNALLALYGIEYYKKFLAPKGGEASRKSKKISATTQPTKLSLAARRFGA